MEGRTHSVIYIDHNCPQCHSSWLRAKDDKTDAYVKVTLEPTWNEEFKINLHKVSERLRFSVLDDDTMNKDDKVGWADITFWPSQNV